MENEFQFQQPLPFGCEGAASSIDEAYFSGICAGLSFRSLLAGDSLEPTAEFRDPLSLRSPKSESVFPTSDGSAIETPLYNFFAESAASSLHHQLPNLLSTELPKNAAAVDSPAPSPGLEADPYGKPRRPRRRQPCKLSDKTSCLRKLLPGDGKMDMATVLEEAYKYIKFLQAQVNALESMPYQSASAGSGAAMNIVAEDLPNLNRQQLLQVVTNSPAVQTQLCAEGCCVYSAEQLILAEKIAERKALINQQYYSLSWRDAAGFLLSFKARQLITSCFIVSPLEISRRRKNLVVGNHLWFCLYFTWCIFGAVMVALITKSNENSVCSRSTYGRYAMSGGILCIFHALFGLAVYFTSAAFHHNPAS